MNSSTAILILAAGSSSRMRLPKQLLPYKRKNLLQRTIDEAVASRATAVYVVLGAHATDIQKSIRTDKATILMNRQWEEGLSSSIRTALASLPETVDAAIVSLCDQPLLRTSVFDDLMGQFSASGKSIIACVYDGSPGVPVLFARKYFPELSALRGDVGARAIVQTHRDDVVLVPFADGAVDLDTPEEYQHFIQRGFRR